RILNKQLIVVTFLVDDLRFYMEMDKFSSMSDHVGAVAHSSMRSKRLKAFLKKKLEIIDKVFLNSDIPPKLRVRPWDPP
ncbi:RGSL protein, partial [Sterrhoptilus dennistouni]|nr:RGSL protein [Sterrhoptilus dennistouni]